MTILLERGDVQPNYDRMVIRLMIIKIIMRILTITLQE